jgi:hypothetical protein
MHKLRQRLQREEGFTLIELLVDADERVLSWSNWAGRSYSIALDKIPRKRHRLTSVLRKGRWGASGGGKVIAARP